MTKITEAQEDLIANVKRAKANADIRLAEIDQERDNARYDALAPLRQAVLDAHIGEVPIRQIGAKGLGTTDYTTIRRLLPDNLDTVAPKPEKVVSSIKGEAHIESISDNLYVVTDVHGKTWEFWTIDFDGHLVVERSNNTDLGKETFSKPVPFEVAQLLARHFVSADLSALEEN